VPESIFEIVTYTVKDTQIAETAREKARVALSGYPGFLGWTRYQTADDNRHFVDRVEWETLADALAAQAAFMTDPAMADFISAIDEVLAMSHVRQLT
jgi:heme-degrading monooxygenase HmoA